MDGDPSAVDPAVLRGVDVFRSQTRGRCINCHEGAELTGASVRRVRESPTRIREGQALDRGFNNIGVQPTTEDRDGTLEIAPLGILDNTPEELADLEAFLRALTDERVLFQRAPFDHPQLFVPDGHLGDQTAVADDGTGTARDLLVEIPAVGRDGGPPLPGFLD